MTSCGSHFLHRLAHSLDEVYGDGCREGALCEYGEVEMVALFRGEGVEVKWVLSLQVERSLPY